MTIYKKLFRDLYEHKGANLAIIIIIAIGIMTFSGAKKTMDDVEGSKEVFYEYCKFPDAYATVLSAPMDFADAFPSIEGIRDFDARMSENVKILGTKKVIRLISISKKIGKHKLIEGRDPRDGAYEILLGNRFAEANNISIGDSISTLFNGKITELRVCGFAGSAENIFAMKDENTIFADPKDFGIAFVELPVMKDATGINAFDEIFFSFERGVVFSDIKNDIEKACESFSVLSVFPRDKQSSDVTVSGEIKELRTTMALMPGLFLMVAAMVMSIMIKRIISQQRGQIGVLKAFGYSDLEVGLHYMLYCAILGVLGGVIGSALGGWLSGYFIQMYMDLFNMEFLDKYDASHYWLSGISLSAIFCAITGILASRKAMKIEPAEAMRQEAPKSGKKSLVERFVLFDMIFNMKGKISVRNIVRTRRRSFFIILGLSLAFAISVLPWSMLDMMNDMLYDRYKYVEKYDAKVNLNSIMPVDEVLSSVKKRDGVYKAQGLLTIPAKLSLRGVKEDVPVVGIPKDSELYVVVDSKNEPVKVDESGMIISENIAKKLGVKVGDELIFESSYARYKDDEISIVVSNIVKQGVGSNGYMDMRFLSKLLGYGPICNSILLDTDDEDSIKAINEFYDDAGGVQSVQSQSEIIAQTEMRMEGAYSSLYGMAVVAMLMSFAIVYNIYLVVILERKHEFATLMVLAMKAREVLSIVSLEQWILAFLAILLGTPIAKLMIVYMSENLSTDMFTMPDDLKFSAVIIAVALMAVSIVLAQFFASKKIRDIDMVEALKAGE